MEVLFTVFSRKVANFFVCILIMTKITDLVRVSGTAISIILLELHLKYKDSWSSR